MKRGIAMAVGVILLLTPCYMSAQSRAKQRSVKDLKGNLKSIQSKRGKVSRELNQAKKAARKVKGDLNVVDARLGQVESALVETTDKLSDGRREQVALAGSLKDAAQELAETREKVRQRLRWYYVHGQESYLSLLVGSKSTGDLATWKDLMERVSAKDREVFAHFRDVRNEVAAKKSRQDRLVTQIRGLVDTQKSQQSELKGVRAEKVEILGDLRKRQADLLRVLRQLDADEAAIERQIEAYLRSQRASGKSVGPAPKGRFGRPTAGRVTSSFGMRFHPILKRKRLHAGVDFSGATGAPIWAANNGVVVASQRMGGYGNVVIVDHGGGITTTYAHCSRIFVSRGQSVRRGQRIASIGSTGLATGPHLHFEVRVNGKAVNPMRYL